MTDDRAPTTTRWHSAGIDMREAEEVRTGYEMELERHLAVRRNGETYEFAHIWVPAAGTLEEGSPYRVISDTIAVPAGSISGTLASLMRQLDLAAALLQNREALKSTLRAIVDGATLPVER